jgi:hypothetical protein
MATDEVISAQSMTRTGRVATVGMGRGARVRRAARTAALLAVATTAVLTAGCTPGGGSADDGRAPDAQRRETARTAHSVLAVKLDNVRRARPHTGLNAADLVYVEQVEGGLSRLMAVYGTRLPGAVGPVRSARETDLELLRQFHRPTLAFSGAQRKLLPLIDGAPLRAEPPGRTSGAFERSAERPSPHNLYVRPDRLLPAVPGPAALTTGFTFGPPPAGGRPEPERTVRYPAARFTFTWSPDHGRYRVAMDGTDAETTDAGPVAAGTVVVQYVRMRESEYHDSLGNRTPYLETVGEGRAEVLRDGRTYEARWQRPDADGGTRFTAPDGSPLDFAHGQVWVVFADAG